MSEKPTRQVAVILERTPIASRWATHQWLASGVIPDVGEPCVFVSIRVDEEGEDPYPFQVTASYNEAARWMDGGERVDPAAIDLDFAAWIGEWVEANYRPEPKERIRPKSFKGREGRLRERG
jgi:hypothetical protein